MKWLGLKSNLVMTDGQVVRLFTAALVFSTCHRGASCLITGGMCPSSQALNFV